MILIRWLNQFHIEFIVKQIFADMSGIVFSNQITDDIHNSIHFILESCYFIVNDIEIWMLDPLLNCFLIKKFCFLQIFISVLICFRTIIFLRSSCSCHHMDNHIVSIITHVVPSPSSLLHDLWKYFRSTVSKVIAYSSVIKKNDIFLLKSGKFLEVIFLVDLVLTNSFS